ncbi:hypothetical protein [Bradyrhizobium sp. WSM3983]|uniref:hypothetical protein n=1 Tax=Bradyrhizobium sp. WSM3983 TaxID=1038867 RepID=UPI00040FDA8C|nr:hypothetical protein [Bradyrhizobium sp. WSM3983]
MIESEIENAVCERAQANGWLVRKFKYIGRRAAADRLFIRGGRVVFIEFKQKGKLPRPGQDREHLRLKAHGAEVHVIDNIEDGLEVLR